ncbi:hypothetical protein GCM10009745_68070 [Kribbella yunnanensis]|uniref:MFS transporter n=1 Tax=Kribbella yunnanensis TaxID=190194 RepID=A0ABN2IRR3_9ACTN
MPSLRETVLPAALGPDFRRIWPAAIISNLGDGALLAAGPLLVASITSAPAAVGAAAFVQQLPWLLFALFSGALADRLDRRTMIVAADLFRAVVLAALGVAVLVGTSPLWAIYVALFLLGTAETLADSASGALLVNAVPKDQLGKANARLYATGTLVQQLGGPPLGALLFAAGAGVPLVFDAVTFAAAAVLIARVTVRPAPVESAGTALWTEVRAGVSWLWGHVGVRTLACSILVIETVVHLVLALTRSPWVAGATMAVFGVHAVVWGIVSTTARQLATPDALMGRVNSVYLLASVGGAAIGSALGGLLAQRFGLTAPFTAAFGAMVLMTAVAWRPLRHVSVRRAAAVPD